MKPAIAAENAAWVTRPAANPRLPNRCIGRSEDCVSRSVRRWLATNAARTTTDAASMPQIQAGQPCSRPSISGNTSRNAPAVASTTPGRSRRVARSDTVLGTYLTASTISTMPTGMLMRKMLRQPTPKASLVMSQPPSRGPTTAAVPETAPTMPKTFARSLGAYMTCTVDSSCGTIRAANPPCTIRAATSVSPLPERQAASDASVKPATPRTKMRWRPKMSPSRPPVMSRTANVSV